MKTLAHIDLLIDNHIEVCKGLPPAGVDAQNALDNIEFLKKCRLVLIGLDHTQILSQLQNVEKKITLYNAKVESLQGFSNSKKIKKAADLIGKEFNIEYLYKQFKILTFITSPDH
jgi:hypothetical protein